MNFRKASIFQRDTEKPEEQNDSGGMLAVWGSPGSGKTITAVKIAKMLSARKKNVILLLCDMAAPMLPCICPADALESKGSLAGVLAAARISENLIKHNLVTFKRNSCLAVLGLLERQNEYSTPPFTQKQVAELLDGLRQIAPYVIVDCGSYIANDILSAVALMEADSIRLYPETRRQMDSWLEESNSKNRNEFVEKALRFYMGYLGTENITEYLSDALVSTLRGIIADSTNRTNGILFKCAVEQGIMAHTIAAHFRDTMEDRRALRGYVVDEVKRTNGQIRFEDAQDVQRQLPDDTWRG